MKDDSEGKSRIRQREKPAFAADRYLFQISAFTMGKKEGGAKTLVDKVVEVIKVQNSPGGSSRQALVKGMKEQFPEVEAAQLKAALKKGVTAKVLEQNGQRLNGAVFFSQISKKS